jgi:outer membrane protein assembly factor BamB
MRLALALLITMLAGITMAAAQNVPTYHGSGDRSGAYVVPTLTWATAPKVTLDGKFHGAVTGQVYAQPLYWLPKNASTGYLIVATESNYVYALNAATGAQIWRHFLGTAVTADTLPCGNIQPSVGVTGTPVIDPAAGTLYLDALISTANGARHNIFGLSLKTGDLLPGWPIDVETALSAHGKSFSSSSQGQRAALAFLDGQLFVAYAGNDGDCDPYHGWILGFQTAPKPALAHFWATRAARGGIWGQSGIAIEGSSLFFTTGNTEGATSWSDGEAVIRTGTGLAHNTGNKALYFTPSDWQTLDTDDTDLGGTAPLPIDVPVTGKAPLAAIIQLGKDGFAYLLDRPNLGGVGGQMAKIHVSTDQIRTGSATYNTANATIVAFEGTGAHCPKAQSGNLTALRIIAATTHPISTLWCAAFDGNGSPIVTTTDGRSDPIFWVVGAEGDNRLYGFNGTTGAVLHRGAVTMSGLHHMQTLIFAAGRFYVAADNKVYAFQF